MPSLNNGPLPGLATPDDIVARLGRNLNQIEAARVDAMIMDGSSIIRRHARNTFSFKVGDELVAVADAGVVVLPGKPIQSVDLVIAKSGAPGVPDIPVYWFIFDGVDK